MGIRDLRPLRCPDARVTDDTRQPSAVRPFSIVAAVCQGIGFTGSVTEILGRADKSRRSGVFSVIYLTSYGGAAIPNLVVGLIPGEYSLYAIMTGYVVLVVAMYAVMLALSTRPYPKVDAQPVRIDGSK